MSKVLMRLLAIGAPAGSRRRGALIIPPSGHGSVGDEAMVMGLAAELNDAGVTPIGVLARGGARTWPPIPHAELVDLPTGSLAKNFALISAFRRFGRVYVVGADCLDGNYGVALSLGLFRAADAAAAMGCTATIVGSSFREQPAPECIEALRQSDTRVRVCSRDPRSHQRMQQMSGRSCDLVADAAFMLRPTPPTDTEALRSMQWIERRRAASRVLLGVNFNRQVLGKSAGGALVDALLDSHAVALRRLIDQRPELDIALLPHDYRGDPSDRDHAKILADRIDDPERAIAITPTLRASELKHIAGLMDLVLTGRMHLAIAALGTGVPVCCVVYQGKFGGLFDHFRMDPITLAPEQVTPDALHAMVAGALDRRAELKAHVAAQLERVRAMSRANLGLSAQPTAQQPAHAAAR